MVNLKDKKFQINKEKHNSFTREQKEYLLEIADCMEDEFGAEQEKLAPLYALIFLDLNPLTEKQIKQGQEIWKKLQDITQGKC